MVALNEAAAEHGPIHDERIVELKKIGVSNWLILLAKEIGYENMLVVWCRLSYEAGNNGEHRVRIQRWTSFLRYQRNQLIFSLNDEGKTPIQIRKYLISELGKSPVTTHIDRIIKNRERSVL